MMPILYKPFEQDFNTTGYGVLDECISCTVTEELNTSYELVMEYPISGRLFNRLKPNRLIYATHDESGERQPFFIYSICIEKSGIATIYARHIFFRMANLICHPFNSVDNDWQEENMFRAVCDQDYYIDNTHYHGYSHYNRIRNAFTVTIAAGPSGFTWSNRFVIPRPMSVLEMLITDSNSLLNQFPLTELKFGNKTINIYCGGLRRGKEKNILINTLHVKDFSYTYDIQDRTDYVIPYFGSGDNCLYPEGAGNQYDQSQYYIPDSVVAFYQHGSTDDYQEFRAIFDAHALSVDGMEHPNESVNRARLLARQHTRKNDIRQAQETLDVTLADNVMVGLNDGPTYEWNNYIQLADTISIIIPEAGIARRMKVTRLEFDVLANRIKSLGLGMLKSSLFSLGTKFANGDTSSASTTPQSIDIKDGMDIGVDVDTSTDYDDDIPVEEE